MATRKFALNSTLFTVTSKTDFELGPFKFRIGKMFGSGMGVCTSHKTLSPTSHGVKVSNIVYFLNAVFFEKRVNAVDAGDSIYGEVVVGSDTIAFTANDKVASFSGSDTLHGAEKLFPLALYSLRNSSPLTELKECFARMKKEVEDTGTLTNMGDILLFCDSFYYDVTKAIDSYSFDTEALAPETLEAANNSGLLSAFESLKGLSDLPPISVFKEKDATPTSTAVANDFDAIKNGDFVLPYEWDEEQKSKIPPLKKLDGFVPSATYYSLVKKAFSRMTKVMCRMDGGLEGLDAIGNDYINVFCVGKPGTGKTTIGYALGSTLGMPVYTCAMTKNTEEDTFQGMTKVIDGKLTFASTDFLYAYEHGGIIILEEINLPDPSVIMGAIGQAVEYPFILMKDGYIPVRRHPMTIIIGTMNVGTYGSKGVNQALSSRFKQTYIIDDPDKAQFVEILRKQGYKKAACLWVYNAYTKIINYLKSPSVSADDIALTVTLRGCLGALENMEEGEEAKQAIKNTLVGKIAEADLELATKVYAEIGALPDFNS